jgi:hypothetical protein
MATTTLTPGPYSTFSPYDPDFPSSTYTVSDYVPTRTASRTSHPTSSTYTWCSIYSESWISTASSWYGGDPRPTYCGGTTTPKSSGLYTSPVSKYGSLNSQLDYENDILDQAIRIRTIALIIGAVFLGLAILFGIYLIIRKKRQRKALENAGIVHGYTLQTYPPPTTGQVRDAGGHVIEAQKPPRRWVYR